MFSRHEKSTRYFNGSRAHYGRGESIGCLAMIGPVIEDIWTLVSAAHHAGQAKVDTHIFPCAESKHQAL